jgi:hypothetical protein
MLVYYVSLLIYLPNGVFPLRKLLVYQMVMSTGVSHSLVDELVAPNDRPKQ